MCDDHYVLAIDVGSSSVKATLVGGVGAGLNCRG
jgi:sugar (pentulose or hexulose) kinase